MSHPLSLTRKRRGAFTLIELLVAVAVLGILVLMLGQVIAMTGQAININSGQLNAFGQARLFFDRLGLDLAARPRRADLGLVFTKAAGNDAFQFYSQVDAYSGTRRIAAVGYRIPSSGPLLQRGASGVDWLSTSANGPLLFLPQPPPAPKDADFETLAANIFRLEFCYILKTGVLSNSHNADFSNVSGLVVAVGALDASKAQLVSASQLAILSGDLPDNNEGCDPVSGWDTAMGQAAFGNGVPPPAVQAVQVFQRVFNVP